MDNSWIVEDDGRARVGAGRGVVNHKLLAPGGRFDMFVCLYVCCLFIVFMFVCLFVRLSNSLLLDSGLICLFICLLFDHPQLERSEYKQLVTDVGFSVER